MQPWSLRPAADRDLRLRDRLRSLRRESGFVSTLGRFAWWLLVRIYLRLYHRLKVDGRGNLPRGIPFVVVANHASHLDALTLSAGLPLSLCDRVSALAAGDTFFTTLSNSAFATLALNALPIWRSQTRREHMAALRQRLIDQRCVYLIFPEGTRSRSGAMAAFKPGLGALVAGTEVPVVPCHISGTYQALPHHGRLPRPHRITLRIGEPMTFAAVADRPDGWREIAAVMESAVRRIAAGT